MSSSEASHVAQDPLPAGRSPKPDYSTVIPVELWLLLCKPSTGLTKADYGNLRRTCTLFRYVFQSPVFERITHRVNPPFNINLDDFDEDEFAARVTTSVLERLGRLNSPPPGCPSLVQDYTLKHWNAIRTGKEQTTEEKSRFNMALSCLCHSLKHFLSLNTLTLVDSHVSEEMIATIASLHTLKNFRLVECSFAARGPLSSGALVAVENLRLEGSNFMLKVGQRHRVVASLKLFSSKKLKELGLLSLRDGTDVLSHLISQGPAPHLHYLEVAITSDSVDYRALLEFLSCCPVLENLIVDLRDRDPWLPQDIRNDLPSLIHDKVVPSLRTFRGPAELAAILVPNRPVTDLGVRMGLWEEGRWKSKTLPILYDMSRSSASIRALYLPLLPPRPELFTIIADRFPDLRNLQLWVDDRTEVAEEEESDAMPDSSNCEMIDVDEEGNPLSSPNSLKVRLISFRLKGFLPVLCLQGIIERLAMGLLKLPPSIESLFVGDNVHDRSSSRTCMTYAELENAVYELSQQYASLQTVLFRPEQARWLMQQGGQGHLES
ncbi:hypothetical protein CVT26_011639 [Gymnopilus dilepis]|uniref:F-box domain-containing protein n=1 Tax=Gymnopilus dilepis TaxID=231916 RepID=A0A409WZJ2_9AGAR|nr:hypothetical protein CVT26_011639 [Gymnopilus dilepis]